jgi:hypothetical protein
VKLTIHLYLLPRLRMSGVIPPLPLYGFEACTDSFTFTVTECVGQHYAMISWQYTIRKGELHSPAALTREYSAWNPLYRRLALG